MALIHRHRSERRVERVGAKSKERQAFTSEIMQIILFNNDTDCSLEGDNNINTDNVTTFTTTKI